jgi:predicted N-formylglutamate amidohydrolase
MRLSTEIDLYALALAQSLSARLDATLLVAKYSRLLIDLNRPLSAPDIIPEHSEIYPVPGNRDLPASIRQQRITSLYEPFHRQLTELIDQKLQMGVKPQIVGVHTFTPTYRGEPRPWTAGVLFGESKAYGTRIVEGLRLTGETIGSNQPYIIHADEDKTVPFHGDARGLEAVLLEIRNDGLRDPQGVEKWTKRLATWL